MRRDLYFWPAAMTGAFLVLLALVLIERGPLPADVGILRGTQSLGVVPDPGASIIAFTLLFGPPIVMLGSLIYKRRFVVALWYAAAVVSSIVVSGTLQVVVGRSGPPPAPLVTQLSGSGASFPSVSLVEVTVQVALICYLTRRFSWAWRRPILALAIANVVLISVLLIDESGHWPTDVLGGLCLGGAWAIVALIVAKRWRRLRESLRQPEHL